MSKHALFPCTTSLDKIQCSSLDKRLILDLQHFRFILVFGSSGLFINYVNWQKNYPSSTLEFKTYSSVAYITR